MIEASTAHETTRTGPYRRRLHDLDHYAQTFRDHYEEVQQWVVPFMGAHLGAIDDHNDGSKVHQSIFNGEAGLSLRDLAAGMQSGLTPQSSEWVEPTFNDKDLAAWRPVKLWLDQVRTEMHRWFRESNFYSASHSCYEEILAFGTMGMMVESDFHAPVRYRPLGTGEYYVSLDSAFRPDVLYRRFTMTVDQVVREYGLEMVSPQVKRAYENRTREGQIVIVHAIEPRGDRNLQLQLSQHLPYASVTYEEGAEHDAILREKGYRTKPFGIGRWLVRGSNAYGFSPAMESLGDIKCLQAIERAGLEALQKHVNPPMTGPSEMLTMPKTNIAGGFTPVSAIKGQQQYAPAFQTNPATRDIAFHIERIEERIKRYFYAHLFFAISGRDKNMTAREVAELTREKLVVLGPVIERIQVEFLDPIVERTFDILLEWQLIPPPPQEVLRAGKPIFNYIGFLPKAARAGDTTAIEDLAMFALNLSQAVPTAVDVVDWDEAITSYGSLKRAPTATINDKQEIAQIRAQRAKQQAAMAAQEQVMAGAQAAKTLSDTEMDKGSALDRLLGR